MDSNSDLEEQRQTFIKQMNAATTVQALTKLEKEQEGVIQTIVKQKLGYKYPNLVPDKDIKPYLTQRLAIMNKLGLETEFYNKRRLLRGEGATGGPDARRFLGGKRKFSRNRKSKKSRKSNRRKSNRRKSNRR